MWLFVIQSLPLRSTNSSSIIPANEQVVVNQRSGRNEIIVVDLESVYPTPEIDGSEMSFDELRASRRGWLTKTWVSEKITEVDEPVPIVDDEVSVEVEEKLAIVQEQVMLDENGAVKEPREGRNRKFRMVEVNETQISKHMLPISQSKLMLPSQNQVIITIRKEAEKEGLS